MIDGSLNSNSINYEVAVEILGQSRQPFMAELRAERAKEKPSKAMIKYLEARLSALDDLQDELSVSDTAAIEKILDKDTRSAWL